MANPPERTMKRQFKPVPDVSRRDPNVDPFMAILAREQRAREELVAIEEVKILEEKVKECYKREGVNHFKNCQAVTKAYFRRIRNPDLKDSPIEMSDVE